MILGEEEEVRCAKRLGKEMPSLLCGDKYTDEIYKNNAINKRFKHETI